MICWFQGSQKFDTQNNWHAGSFTLDRRKLHSEVTSIDSENNKLGLTMVDARAQRSTGTKAEGWSGTKAETNVFCRNGFSMVLAKRSAHSCRVALSFLVLDSMTGRRFRAVFFGGSLGPFSFLSTPRDLDVFDVLRLVAPGRQKGLFSKKKS